jgi:mannosyltransferase
LPFIRRRARFLERYRPCRLPAGASLFHSSYYRLPGLRGTPTVVTAHDFVYERYASGPRRWVHSHQKHAAIRAAQAVICVSESTRQDLLEFVGQIPGQAVHVIHNGVSKVFRPLSPAPAPVPYVLYVGERRRYKNFRLLLRAMEFLPDLELHCVGGGALRADELAGAPSDVRDRVRHRGFVSDEVLNELYNRAFCLVYPSSYEGFGIPVVEAMRAGCPVVSIQCKAVMEAGGDALTVAAETDPRALADAVLRLDAADYRRRMVAAGLEVAGHFSWDRTHARTLDVYRSLGATLQPASG